MMNVEGRVRGLRADVDELYAKVARAGGAGSLANAVGFISVEKFRQGAEPDYQVFRTAIAFVADTGIALWVPARTYTFTQPASGPVGTSMPSNVLIWASAGARFVNAQSFTGTQRHCIFYAQATGNGNAGTLAADAVQGLPSLSVNMTSEPTVGSRLAVSKSLSQQTFLVVAVSGAGPYTVTLDRPVVLPFTAVGSVVSEFTAVPTDIHLRMNGATCSGTGDRIVEIVTGFRCSVSDWHYDTAAGALGDYAFSFDIGGYQCGFDGCTVDGTGAGGLMAGIALESQEDGWIANCVVTNPPTVGIAVLDGIACNVDACRTSGSAQYGFAWGTDASLGSFDGSMVGCTSYGDVWGLVLNGSTNARFVDCSFKYATNTGVLFNAAGIDGTTFVGCAVDGSATGFNGGAGNTNTRLLGFSFNGCTVECLTSASDFDGVDLEAIGLTATMSAFVFTGANAARIRGLTLTHSGIVNGINFTGVGRGELDGATISIGASSNAVQVAGASLATLRCVRTLGSAVGTTGVLIAAASTLRQGDACDFSSAATAVSNGGFWNRKQTVVANGATPVAIPWPDAKSTDTLVLELHTVGGTPGHPTYTITPGTGFTLVSQALDTSTYEYFVP